MQIISKAEELPDVDLAFVPTMGALHAGHLHLIHVAQAKHTSVLVSIFVNPKQFGADEDFSYYPRPLDDDLQLLRKHKVNYVYLPQAEDLFPDNFQTYVHNPDNSSILCGRYRPDHFQGVLTVVLKLLLTVRPQLLVLGKKDYQQLTLIKQMITDFSLPVEVSAAETQRHEDGLAYSSRNKYLTQAQRQQAPLLYQALQAAQQAYRGGERQTDKIIAVANNMLGEFDLDYLEIRTQASLAPVASSLSEPSILLASVRLGNTRLLDNIELTHNQTKN